MRSRCLLTLVVMAALSSGCAATVSGAARPDPGYSPPSATPKALSTAWDALGDPIDLDPCALLDTESLREFGDVSDDEPESFDYCRLTVAVPTGGPVVLRVGELADVESAESLRGTGSSEVPGAVGDLRLFEQKAPQSCTYTVLFTDMVTLTAVADIFDAPDDPVDELCDIADAAATAVMERLESGEPVDRVDHPAKSVARLDACDAVADPTVAAVLGQQASVTRPTPAGHQCRWGAREVPSMSVRYVRGSPTSGDGAVEETIAGRTTTIISAGISDRALCLAEAAAGLPSELAQVIVRFPAGQTDQACAAARTVAAEVWAALPA